MKKIYLQAMASGLVAISWISTNNAMNYLRPWDTMIRPWYTGNYPVQLAVFAEGGVGKARAFDRDGHNVNPLQIWNPDQNALAMLAGFSTTSEIGQLLLEIDATDDGTRGHFCVSADLDLKAAAAFSARWFFCENWSLSAWLPVYSYRLHNVQFIDQTQDLTPDDFRVKELLTDNIKQNVRTLGCLCLDDWHRTGAGDLNIFLEWFRDFPQPKPLLKEVRLNWRIGLGIPTCLEEDTHKLFAFPFGYDKAFSLPFGLGLDLTFVFHLRAGFDVQLRHIFGNTRMRRIKTNVNQTDLLLLETARVYKDFGLVQRFNLYGELHRILGGLSLKLGYQFWKQGRSHLSVTSNEFSNEIANTAESLREHTFHQFFAETIYDFGPLCNRIEYHPELKIYARCPFNGQRAVTNIAIGSVLSVEF